MTIVITWHLILMLIISLIFIIWIFQQASEHGDWSILTIVPILLFLGFIWAIYGGIFWW